MSLVALNLYCQPQDVYDYLGTEGGQLRQDDHNLATGQMVVCTTTAALGATTMNVAALTGPLLAGSVLQFDGAGMPAIVEVTLSATANVGATTVSVNPLSAAVNGLAAAYDNGVNIALAQRLVKSCQYGTAQVKSWCCSRYDDSALSTSWSVNRWATVLAARWLCRRRGQSAPQGVEEEAKEVLQDLKYVRTSVLNIEDLPTRTSGWPYLSNITIDLGYDYRKARVEQTMSELTPTQFPQSVDWNSALWIEL